MNAKTEREIKKLDKAIEDERRNKLAWRKAVRNSEVAVMTAPPGVLSWFRDEGGEWWFRPGYSSGAELARDRYMRKMHDIYLARDEMYHSNQSINHKGEGQMNEKIVGITDGETWVYELESDAALVVADLAANMSVSPDEIVTVTLAADCLTYDEWQKIVAAIDDGMASPALMQAIERDIEDAAPDAPVIPAGIHREAMTWGDIVAWADTNVHAQYHKTWISGARLAAMSGLNHALIDMVFNS